MLSVLSMLAWLGYLIYRERRMVQQLSAELRHDRESHVQDLVEHATAWRLMSSTSNAGFQKAERQAMVYGMETATITAAAATLPSPQSVPADATIQIRRVAQRPHPRLRCNFRYCRLQAPRFTGLEYQSFRFQSPDTVPLHYLGDVRKQPVCRTGRGACAGLFRFDAGRKAGQCDASRQRADQQSADGHTCRTADVWE
jgi:hypothetical protein